MRCRLPPVCTWPTHNVGLDWRNPPVMGFNEYHLVIMHANSIITITAARAANVPINSAITTTLPAHSLSFSLPLLHVFPSQLLHRDLSSHLALAPWWWLGQWREDEAATGRRGCSVGLCFPACPLPARTPTAPSVGGDRSDGVEILRHEWGFFKWTEWNEWEEVLIIIWRM